MEHSNAEGHGTSFNEVKEHANAMDEIFEANYGEGLEAVHTSNLHADSVMDRAMPHPEQDDSDYIENILAPFEETHEFFEDLECRFTVSAMVADAVTNGMVRAVLEESSEALAAKEAEILVLNEKLEDRDAKLWELEETLQFKQDELVVCKAESKSDLDRLVLDFMHEKERMQRRLHETETVIVEKERELATKNERILAMATELEAERNKIMIMEERIQNMQNVKASSEEKTSALVGELERAKAEQVSVHSSIREGILQNESELMERSQQVENVERVVLERNEPIGFLERSISFLEKQNYESLQNVGTQLRQTDISGIDISHFQQEIGHPKKDFEAELVEKKREVSDLAEELEQCKVCNELQTSVIVGILETFIQESEHQISQLKQDLDSKDKEISSLTCTVSSQRLDCARIQAQISSSHVMDAEIENNLSSLKGTMEMQCSKLEQDLGEERMSISANLSTVTKLQLVSNGLAESLRHKLNLEQVEEKLAEQQWQQEIELEFVNQVFAGKLGEAMQLIAVLYSILEEKETELGSHLSTTCALETALNVVWLEVPRLQEIVKNSESLDYNLSSIHLHKIDAEFNKLRAKILQLASKLDSFENTSQASFHQIQSWVVSFQEKLLQQQWKKNFEDEIIALVLSKFLNDLEGQFETGKHKEGAQLSTVQARWDEGRLALMNEMSNLRQELELLKIEEPVKSSFFSDVGNSNGYQVLSRLTQEARNEEATEAQRKERAAGRLSASQFSTGMSRMENSYVTSTTGKITGHSIRESDLPEHNPTETVDIQESPLKSMTKEQLMIHFKRVEAELKREIECIMDEKTEEIYRLKRDFLRERDSFHSGKDREFDALKKRIAEVIRMLNKFDEENGRLSASLRLEVQNYEMVCKLKDELQAENRRLLNILRQKERELKALSDKLSDALRKDAECSSTETCLLKQISELQSEKEDIDLQNRNEIQILRTIFEETIKEKEINLNSLLKEREEIMKQKLLLEDIIHEKDMALKLSVMKKEEQEQKLALMEKLIEEKEKTSGLALRELEDVKQIEKQEDSLDLALKECEDLKKQKAHLETILQIKDSTIDSVASKQEELKKHITLLREGMEEKDNQLKMAVGHLEEVMEEKKMLERIIEEKKNALCLHMQKEEEQRKQLEAIIAEQENALTLGRRNIEEHEKAIVSLEETLELKQSLLEEAMRGKEEEEHRRNLFETEVQELKDAIKNMQGDMETLQKQNKMEVEQCVRSSMDAALELECRVTENIQDKILRLEGVKLHLKKLCEQANLVALRESYYRGNLGKKYYNLQKAEVEVDLLGDEVENLLSLLEKVYFALDHYLPILQHYPGIPELLKLIRRELIAHVDNGLQL